jgi:multicomponent K+:H+ antiporter subunit C
MSLEAVVATVIGLLAGCGTYLLLRARTFPVLLGLTLLSYAVNLFLFAAGGLVVGSAPLANERVAGFPDPLPQALVLTAIVIGFGMTALLVVLALRAIGETGDDHVDGGPG